MSYTSFGEFVRILRIKNHEVMGDMAKVLDVKVPFLSAVENGKKNVPANWLELLSFHYDLNAEEKEQLRNAIEESKTQVKINLSEARIQQRRAAMQFARSFDEMDADTATKILELLKSSKEKN